MTENQQPPKHQTSDKGLWVDLPHTPKSLFQHSLILGGFQTIVLLLWLVSLIEYWKILFMACARQGEPLEKARSLAIDTYMILKWVVLLVLIFTECHSVWARIAVSYLIASALFSFFYYHTWKGDSIRMSYQSQLRRTAGFVISFFFGIVGYAFLFQAGHAEAIAWPNGAAANFSDAFLLSLSNAFTANFGAFELLTSGVRWLAAGEMLFVFGFIVIIVVNSLPARDLPVD